MGKGGNRHIVEGESGAYSQAKRKIKRHEEIHVQRPIVRVLAQIEGWTKQLTFFHVPNQLLRRPYIRKIYAGLGVRSGVPDLPIALPGGKTLWVELKYKGNGLSDDQNEFMGRLKALGHITHVIDAKDAVDAQRQLFDLLAAHGLTDFRLRNPRE